MTHLIPIRPAAMDAWRALQGVLDDCHSVPCNGRTEWISESAEDREYAAGHCRGCPALTACGKYADAAKEVTGVWGGRDRTPEKRQPATPSLPMFDAAECRPSSVSTPNANAANAI